MKRNKTENAIIYHLQNYFGRKLCSYRLKPMMQPQVRLRISHQRFFEGDFLKASVTAWISPFKPFKNLATSESDGITGSFLACTMPFCFLALLVNSLFTVLVQRVLNFSTRISKSSSSFSMAVTIRMSTQSSKLQQVCRHFWFKFFSKHVTRIALTTKRKQNLSINAVRFRESSASESCKKQTNEPSSRNLWCVGAMCLSSKTFDFNLKGKINFSSNNT